MAVSLTNIDQLFVDMLRSTAIFRDIQSLRSQDDFYSRLDQLGESMESAPLRQKISLHKNSFDDILGMSDIALHVFGLDKPPSICGVLYGAISVAATESTPEVFSAALDMIGQCNLGCAKLCAHYKEVPNPSGMSLKESQPRFAAAYEVVLAFLGVVVRKFDFRPIRE
jgi:hypothetical protein